MASKFKFRLNSPGVAAWMAANLPGPVMAAAQEMAGNIDGDLPVSVRLTSSKSDGRPVGLVTITHAKGLASQAKHGTLTRAAAQAGLDVTRYSR